MNCKQTRKNSYIDFPLEVLQEIVEDCSRYINKKVQGIQFAICGSGKFFKTRKRKHLWRKSILVEAVFCLSEFWGSGFMQVDVSQPETEWKKQMNMKETHSWQDT